jgi:hypothetical protein
MIKTWIEKLKALYIYAVMSSFFDIYWEETMVRINDKEVIELGGFILILLIFLGCLFLLNYIGVINLLN